MQRLFLDFETASECDLKTAGLDNYAKHPTTRVLCMAYAVDDGPVSLWLPGHPLIDASGVSVWAHNSAFEFAIWNHVYNPTNPLVQEQMYCTMSMAAAMGLPQSLEMAALASGIDQKKDTKAHRVMMKLCKPDKNGKFYDPENYPEDFKILYDYCKQDVEVERALAKRLAPLSGREREVWLLDQTINARGVGIDVSSATKFRELIDSEQERLQKDLQQITEGEVLTVGSTAQLKKWMKSKGVEVESIDKAHTQELLHDQSIPGEVIDALLIREEAAKSSNAKYKAMLDGSNDGRVRNLFQYFGATTGRWSGRKVQLQNLPRPKLKQAEIEAAIERPRSISLLHPSVMHVASDCIRGMFIPTEGYSFVCADFSNIEGRIAAWIAGEVWKTEAFSAFDLGRGHDIYRLAYSKAFRIPVEKVTDEQRQIGKVMELALGFGGSVGAFQNMAKNYGVKVSDEKAKELVDAWRDAHPKIRNYWYSLEEAATQAITHPGNAYKVGKVAYIKKGSFLCCRLPSGRVMYYPYPKIEMVDTPWGEKKMGITYMSQDSMTKKWTRCKTYGGSLFENIVQAAARDILADAMLRLEDAGFKIVMHVHDEIVAEVPTKNPKFALEVFEKGMSEVPQWAQGLPIVAKGWTGLRYRKG